MATPTSLEGDKSRGKEIVLLADARDVGILMSADIKPVVSKMLHAVARNRNVADIT